MQNTLSTKTCSEHRQDFINGVKMLFQAYHTNEKKINFRDSAEETAFYMSRGTWTGARLAENAN
tara:strand:+ start:677 stop:868 length:192 start_codon:yes stop_codon:yes gene_type:complete